MEDDSDQHSVTSILRFKSVCKHWRLLPSHRRFTHWYDINNLSKSVGLFGRDIYVPFDVENRSPPPFLSLDFHFNRSNVIIEQSCNGLLLCSAYHNWDFEYYVFNPTTKQLAFIPSVSKFIYSMALAFHQTHCVHYKVVCVCASETFGTGTLLQIQVYFSDTGKWKICIESFSDTGKWKIWAPYFESACDFFYFKLDVEQLQTLSAPDEMVPNDYGVFTTYFGESRGHLHLISHTECKGIISQLNVHEMLRDRSGWFVKYRVRFDELPGFPEMFDYDSRVVDVVRGKEEEETFLVLVTPRKVMRYNVHDKSFNQIYSQTNDNFYNETASCHRYIVALTSF